MFPHIISAHIHSNWSEVANNSRKWGTLSPHTVLWLRKIWKKLIDVSILKFIFASTEFPLGQFFMSECVKINRKLHFYLHVNLPLRQKWQYFHEYSIVIQFRKAFLQGCKSDKFRSFKKQSLAFRMADKFSPCHRWQDTHR